MYLLQKILNKIPPQVHKYISTYKWVCSVKGNCDRMVFDFKLMCIWVVGTFKRFQTKHISFHHSGEKLKMQLL